MKKIITLVFASAFFLSQAQTTQTFNYTGSLQTFVVPPCVTSLTIEAYGAQGFRAQSIDEFGKVFQEAIKSEVATVIDCPVASEEDVFPFVPPGRGLKDVLYGAEGV